MGILTVEEIAQGRSMETDSERGRRRVTRAFQIKTNSRLDTPLTVQADPLFPVDEWEIHPEDSNLYCTHISTFHPERNAPQLWQSACTYVDRLIQPSTDPLLDPTDWYDVDGQNEEREILRDADGALYSNSTGIERIVGATRLETFWIFKGRKNVAPPIPAWFLTVQNRINSAAISIDGLSVPARWARLHKIRMGRKRERNTTPYYAIEIEVHVKQDGWDNIEVDRGFFELDPDNAGKLRRILIGDKTKPTEPMLLDGAGAYLGDDAVASDAVTLTKRTYDEINFNTTIPHFQ